MADCSEEDAQRAQCVRCMEVDHGKALEGEGFVCDLCLDEESNQRADDDDDFESALADSSEEEEDCWDCRGTGIGNPHVDGSRCPTCGGSGVPRRERDSAPPSEPPSSYRGP